MKKVKTASKISLFILIIILLTAAVFLVFRSRPSTEQAGAPTQREIQVLADNFFNSLRENLDTKYISPVDWPPSARILDGEQYSCTEAGREIERGGETGRVLIEDREYCVTKTSEGAAGSIYRQYAYIREIGGTPIAATFSFRFVQCLNYDEPQQSECKAEQESFDINPTIHRFFEKVEQR